MVPSHLITKTTKGGKTKLEDLRGKYVYIDVWATWCVVHVEQRNSSFKEN